MGKKKRKRKRERETQHGSYIWNRMKDSKESLQVIGKIGFGSLHYIHTPPMESKGSCKLE